MAITQDDFLKLQRAREFAEKDDTPFAVVANDEIHVVGDANKTQVKKHDYTMMFYFPNEWKGRFDRASILKEGLTHFAVEIDYTNITITPRNHVAATTALVELEPFFNKILDNGEVVDLTMEDVKELLRYMSDDMTKALYNAVGTILGVDKSIIPYMGIMDVMFTASLLIRDFPEAINEANQLFEFSAERARKRANL